MKCYVCDKTEFEILDSIPKFNEESIKKDLLICKHCGAVSYRIEEDEQKKLVEFYRNDYRNAPDVNNVITTNRKLKYIQLFMQDYLIDKKELTVGEIGSATGYLLAFFRSLGHTVHGTELTKTYRRFSEHHYGIPLSEELPKKEYDLICIYHTLEHMPEPDKVLKKYHAMLKDGGHMLIATPEWFNILEEAGGQPTLSFTHLYHHNHINPFSQTSIKNLFNKVGLEIVKEDHLIYGQSYLVKKSEAKSEIVKEKWEDIKKIISDQKEAINLFNEKKYRDALEKYPKYPEPYIALIFDTHGKVPEKQKELFQQAFDAIPNNLRLKSAFISWLYRMEQHKDCIQAIVDMNNYRPNEENFMTLGFCFYMLGDKRNALRAFVTARELNPLKWNEATLWICKCCSEIPNYEEVAEMELKEKLFKEYKAK